MIKVFCPHCKKEFEITREEEIFNLNRLKQSLCKCIYCNKTFLAFYDGNDIKAVRISK